MAQRVVTEIIDDIDCTTGAEAVSFALNGIVCDIDLSAANAQSLEDTLAPFIRHARRTTTSRLVRVTRRDRSGKRIKR